MTGSIDEQIRSHAYRLWEKAGRPEGRDDEFWLEAERELRAEGETSDDPLTEPLPQSLPG